MLSVKGLREKSLLDNLKKIYPSKINLHNTSGGVTKTAGRYDYDNPQLTKEEVDEQIMKATFDYKNNSTDNYIEIEKINDEAVEHKKILEILYGIENKLTEFLIKIDKEWDCKENRDIWVKTYIFIII